MRGPLTLTVAQPPTVGHDVAANALAHADAVRTAGAMRDGDAQPAAGQVVLFPEMSLTGYELDAAPVDPDDARLAPIVDACRETGSLALVGAPVTGDKGHRHIGVLAVDGGGARVAYRKMFLGGAEPAHFTPGPAPAVVEVAGWRLGLAVCKDTGVPERAAVTAALGIDAYLAGAVDAPHESVVQQQRAARVTAAHRVRVAIASFAGGTGGGYTETAGRSRIWAPDGRLVAEAGPQPGELARATFS
ncbi:carbon-nitrogen hydrolase family protein [Micromonospora sp. LOL_015]|uniref:carbon-nitrogen hydrolase family protein n=1 Tax=Micromonospora sp. LOL_015 TaxID=3345416 RepID=UPI003A8969C3